MKSVFSHINTLINESLAIAERYLPEQEINRLHTEITHKLSEKQLQIMLFGAYNAGKSTLVNTLLGEEAAPTNDVPTTFSIDNYDWQGFKLIDTPGVNAPIEHEQVTEEQVKRSDLLLFVIREGDQDSKDLYNRLFDFLERGKKIFIVLNHQASNQDEIKIAYQKIYEIIGHYALKRNIATAMLSDLFVYPVNLRTAYNAVTKQSLKLLEHSGFTEFRSAFNQWLIQFDNEQSYLSSIQNQIDETWFTPIINIMEKELGVDSDLELKALNEQVATLKYEKRFLLQSASNRIHQELKFIKPQIISILKSAEQDPLEQIQTLVEPVVAKIETWLNTEVITLAEKLTVRPTYTSEGNTSEAISEKSNQFYEQTASLVKEKMLDKDVLTEGLKLGRKLKIPGLKGRWEKTLGRWAGKAAVFLQIASTLYDGYKAGEAQDKKNQQMRQYELEVVQAAEQVCSTLTSELYSSIELNINEHFNGLINSIMQKIETITSNLSEIKRDRQQMCSINNDLMNLYFES